ncbi:transcriptional regulator GcvA [Chitinasiproducens palmae]|uniref:LysR family transcriptional regulator, glycine cleavage system transcriptional activator n=1 Tax=Chitinasiproducens palmae TaxID=1770053 RepID=A0A1H2PNV6_9BURK|nr:transcriptional regulator GcvA [Chitinasiproducens palmae]SDV48355.1 LysR family transcriptional regulator, glycine cleavage system transcriptional activator [Chitinasiproducens palmae]
MKIRDLPPMATLRAFEAASRLQSFTGAAEELFVTHGAVSQQVRALEAQLGVSLFVRKGKRVTNTEAGQRYARKIAAALQQLADASDEVAEQGRERRLVISTLPSFAARWLMPRIGSFIEAHPDIDLELRASTELVDLQREGVDVAIRHGSGHYPGLHVEKLMDEYYFAACSPNFNDGILPATPRELIESPLLHSSRDESWRAWLDRAGLHEVAEPTRGSRYFDSTYLLDAAIAGHGVALVRHTIALADIAEGRLVKLFDIEVPASFALFFVCTPSRLALPRVQLFRAWLLETMAAFQAEQQRIRLSAAQAGGDRRAAP